MFFVDQLNSFSNLLLLRPFHSVVLSTEYKTTAVPKYKKQILKLIINYDVMWHPEQEKFIVVGMSDTGFRWVKNRSPRSKNAM